VLQLEDALPYPPSGSLRIMRGALKVSMRDIIQRASTPWHGTTLPHPTLSTNSLYMPIARVPSPCSPPPPLTTGWEININDGQILHDNLPMHSSHHCPCHCHSYFYPIHPPHPPLPLVCIFEHCSLFCPNSWSHFHLLSTWKWQ
jgi:hypothetical protein